MPVTYTVLVSFNGSDGESPYGGLLIDANGNLFGTTEQGGTDGYGTVFEIANTTSGYAATPIVLASFDGTDGQWPTGGLFADAHGDLLGTTANGAANGDGTVFEISKTAGSYASAPAVMFGFNASDGADPLGNLVADAAGDLFGVTFAGPGTVGDGTVFELARTASGYASTPTVLATFNGTDGAYPDAGLLADNKGDLFGTTLQGGADGDGTVFEIANTASGYASTPIVLASFTGSNGQNPIGGALIADTNGDLFGTAQTGGAHGDGTIFEIARTANGYAGTLTVLVSFNDADGFAPTSLIADAKGDLFGTTFGGGAHGMGTVFELAKTSSGYAGTPTVLFSFDGSDGAFPVAGLTADTHGNLFGTTLDGGVAGDGTAFEISNAGFVVCYAAGTRIATPAGTRPIERLRAGDLVLAGGVDGVFRPRPVRWVGHRVLDLATHPDPELAAPIRLLAGALGPGWPARDLVVSPDHCLLLDRHLLRAYRLRNGVSVVQEHPPTVDYWHVELDGHALLLAEGVPAESYLDEGTRDFFHADGPPLPGPLGPREIAACAPYAPDDAFAERVWRGVAARAGAGPPPPAPAACVEVFANGRKLRPLLAERDRRLYALPRSTQTLRIVSDAVRPTAAKPWLQDRRRLGIGVRRVGLEHGATLPLDGPGFAQGWHGAEPGVRWSDGDAVLRLPPDAGLLDLHVAHPS
jgi:uncharacterized repeat protein (TIGR03803 family)